MNTVKFKKKKLVMAVSSALLASLSGTAAADETVLNAIVVKGEKIERKLEDTLSSVVVTTAKDIREHGDTTLTDIMARTPGVYTQSGNENWGIRGVPVSGFDDQGPATTNGAVSVYVDGALQPHRMLTLSPLPLWDVEQVEVYRGPQSTNQGRNALAGSVILQTKNPTYKPSFAAQTNVGSYGERGASLAVGGGIVPGKVAGRFAVDVQDADGYIHNEALDKDANPLHNVNMRGKLLIQPMDKLDILLTLAHTKHRRGIQAVNADNGRPRYYQVNYNTEEFDEIEQNTATAKLDYYLNDAWTLTSITSGSEGTYDALLDFDQEATSTDEVIRVHKNRLFNQEVRLGYKAATLRGQMGLYYGRTKNNLNDRLDFSGTPFGSVLGNTRITNRAIFGEVNWDFLPRWQMIAGLRYDRERNTTVFEDDFASTSSSVQSKDFSAVLPKVGLSYQLAQDQLIGAVVQRGYRSGGVNVRAGTSHVPYDPEYTTNYELSYRGSWLDKKLRTYANLYYTNWKDQQVSREDVNGDLQVSNAARSRMKGLELWGDYDVTRAFRLSASAAYGKTRYIDFVTTDGENLSGQSFLYAPKLKLSLGGTYRFENRFTVNLDVVYQQGSPSQYITNASGQVTDVRRSDSATLVNVTAGYKIGGASFNAYVKNLFDKKYITNNQSDTILDVGAPRTIGVAVRYDL